MEASRLGESCIDISDHFEVKTSLDQLVREQLVDLGGALGLSYPKIMRMNDILNDVSAAWLNRQDRVLEKSGEPTWARLADALEQIDQLGVAEDIRNHKCRGRIESRPSGIESGVWQFPQWVMCIVAAAVILLVVSLLGYFWPTIMYKLNLYHSKSLPYSGIFLGREREMEEMMKFVNFRNLNTRIVNVIGSPGFGKSTLAINVGHEVVRNGDMVHYVNMADFPSKADVKLVLCEKIFDSARVIHVAKNISFEALLRWARKQFYSSLLILDNCDDVIHNQKEEFHDAVERLVEASLSFKVLITSREIVPFIQSYEWFKVDELSVENAQILLESKVLPRVSLTQEETKEVAKLTGNVPLALQIIGSLLCLPDSPMPRTVINELTVEPMEVLSPPNFPANKRIFNTINLSYKYLSKESQKVGRQLAIFPGSFTYYAAIDVICGTEFLPCPPVTTALRNLVLTSLLEYNQRTYRYHCHRLIREYFKHVQNEEEAAEVLPNFHTHYFNELMSMSENFKSEYKLSVAFIDSERHNIQYLLELIPSLPTKDFLVGVMTLSKAIDVGLLRSMFSKAELCVTLNASLTRLDYVIIFNDFDERQEVELIARYSKEDILSQYLKLINQVAICIEEARGISSAISIYNRRRLIIENRSLNIDPVQYTDYFTVLSNYYLEYGYESEVISCHRAIIRRTNAHLATCNPYQCNYYDIGDAYYNMHEYQKAAELLELALAKSKSSVDYEFSLSFNCLDHLKILMKLYYTYDNLGEYDNAALILSDINVLQPKVLETPSDELFSHSDMVQMAIDLFKDTGYVRDAMLLEEKLMSSVKDVGVKAIREPWTFGFSWQIDRENKMPLNIAYNVANHLYQKNEYIKIIEIVTYFIDALKNTTGFRDKVIHFHVLLGKVMFAIGNYSEGMNEMELALNIIENLEQPFLYWRSKSTACWYLIPRVRYIETCYNVSQVPSKTVHYVSLFILYGVFSPYPFAFNLSAYNLRLWPVAKSSSMATAGHSNELLATTQEFELFSTTVDSSWHYATSMTVDDHIRTVRFSVIGFFTALLNTLTVICHLLYISIWIIIVWLKLIFLHFMFTKRYKEFPVITLIVFYCTIVPFVIFYVLRHSEKRPSLTLMLQGVCDPRLIVDLFYN